MKRQNTEVVIMKSIRVIFPAAIALDMLKPRMEPLRPGESIHLYNVYGVITGIKRKVNKKGDWSCLRGDFEAFYPSQQQVFCSKSLILEQPAIGEVLTAMKAESTADWHGTNLEFAAQVRMVPPKSPGVMVGFEIESTLLIEPVNKWERLRSDVIESGGISALGVSP